MTSLAHARSRLASAPPKQLAIYAVAAIGALVVISPFFVMLSISVSSGEDVFTWPPQLLPSTFEIGNYWEVLTEYDFGRYLLNSLIVAGTTTVVSVTLDSLAGYAFAKLPFRGRNGMFIVILATIMIPVQVTMIPLFVLFRSVPLLGGNDWLGHGGTGLLDTYPALILPSMASTFGIYLMREFFRMLPSDLMDAGRVDGLSEWAIFRRIYLPLAKPALATVGIVAFTDTWNSFLWPLIATSSDSMRTVQLGLSTFKGQYFTEWQLLMAAVVITIVPVFMVFLLGQKHFVRGMALSGLKG